ncbi:uncharacterized protein LOC106172354 isoform X2 [Lingula anatina]|uniref:Uncharacterized protein LOC106172354 isoform X2 n=1 Tax=Lingula anatina TaxID=7574 RepID=A0A1S3JDQ4_LINAN|nr:uncharacterized protein LOC106172354 isoform X2 [Lingula anatina]|eukprot:XP_013408463.1 uncharacterized protein LOC106172354 isoform X2 [Lingula anatina]
MGDTSTVTGETTIVTTMRATTENSTAGLTTSKTEEWYETGAFKASVIGGTLVLIAIIIILVTVYIMRKKKNGNEKDGNDTSSITPDNLHMSEDGTGRRLSNYQNYGYASDEDDNNSGDWTGMSPNRLPRHPWETQIPDTIHPHSQKDRGHLQGLHGDNNHRSQPRDIFYTSPNERFENDRNRNFGYNKQPMRGSQGEEHFQGRDRNSPPLSSSPRPDFSHHNYMGEVVPQKRFSYLEEGSPMPSPTYP